jgi:transcriptional regulator with XRE-family HTH domain
MNQGEWDALQDECDARPSDLGSETRVVDHTILSEALHRFVRERRLQIAPDSRFLGEHRRLPIRVGKPVSQEELAEHLGISRQWYGRFERGAPAAFSAQLLNGLSDLLLLSASERAELVRLAMPQLATAASPDSTNLYEALLCLRQSVRRIWNATSETEIVMVAAEEARRLLPRFEVIFARHAAIPEDEALLPHPGDNSAERLADARADALSRFTPQQLAETDSFLQRNTTGAILASESYPPDNLRVFRSTLHEHHITWALPTAAFIRLPSGAALVGGASSHPQEATEFESSMLSAVADFASLALR